MKIQFEIKNSDLKKMLALNELLFDGDEETKAAINQCIDRVEPVVIDTEVMNSKSWAELQSVIMILALNQLEKEAKSSKDEQGVS